MKLSHIDGGKPFDWDRASDDYAKFRDIYPNSFYKKIVDFGLCKRDQHILDLGTGTGVLPRHLSTYGASFVGVDISENQIARAKELSKGRGIEYIAAPAEDIDFPDGTFDNALACQCYIYFDQNALLPKLYKALKPEGRFCVMSLIWLHEESPIAAASEALVLEYNPSWSGAGFTRPKFNNRGIPSGFDIDTSLGFEVDFSYSFDIPISFTREKWHGRIRACRGIGASSMTEKEIAAFDAEHIAFLEKQRASFKIMHSAVFCVLKKYSLDDLTAGQIFHKHVLGV